MKRNAGQLKNDYRQSRFRCFAVLSAVILSLSLFPSVDGKAADPAADYPSRQIELVTQNAPGGAMDVAGRLITDIIQKDKILSQPMVVVNKAGAGGGVSYSYTFEKKGNPHVVLIVATTPFLTLPLRESLPYNYKSFTPIANLVTEGSVLVVRSESPFKTIDDLIAQARKRPETLIHGMGSPTSNEAMMGELMQKAKNVKWNILPFATGEGEALLNLLSGNVDFVLTNRVNIGDYIKAGKLRIILTCTLARNPLFKDVPTYKEAGFGEPVITYRGILGPPGMPDYAVRKIEGVFKRVLDHERFQKYMGEQGLEREFMPSGEYAKFLDTMNDRWKVILSELKLLKKK